MGQVKLSLSLNIGPTSAGEDVFPGQEIDIASTTNPSPKTSQVRDSHTRNLNSASAFVALSGIGPDDTVTNANILYVRTTSPMRIRVTYKDLPADLVSVFVVQGTYFMEVPDSNPIILLEAMGVGFIEYATSGNQLLKPV